MLAVLNFAVAEVRLPSVFSDNMVLQREIPVNIWGWAKPGEKVSVVFNNQNQTAITGKDGKWKLQLNPMKAGGPYDLTIKGKNVIVIKNILIGDVWLCSGQSNMEFEMKNSRNWETDKLSVGNSSIRLYTVPRKTSISTLVNTEKATWNICNSITAENFSAVGYYFGKNLQQQLNIPIGLINCSWGGTDIETWTSMESIYNLDERAKELKNSNQENLEKIYAENALILAHWQDTITVKEAGIVNKWYLPGTDISDWKEIKMPQPWEMGGYPGLDGVVWLRKEFELTKDEAAKTTKISLGPIDDCDETYINGKLVGKTEYQFNKPRIYKVEPGVLNAGKNILIIKVTDAGGNGGLFGTCDQLYLDLEGTQKSLCGIWKMKISIDSPFPKDMSNPNLYPTLLYNGMVNPLINFGIKGVIWYQGENNVPNYKMYRTLLPNMITDWRTKWNEGNFPFLFVQIANFKVANAEPVESDWAGLREAQSMALSLPATGMAVIIDIGDATDIHPTNKDDVGYRLSLAARKIAYGEDQTYSGPTYKSMKIEGNKIILEFDNTGSGLFAKDKYGYLKGFAIAGSDKKYSWARATITSGNTITVENENILSPIAVRYGWADNPDDINLYNMEMLPASPFRTDNW